MYIIQKSLKINFVRRKIKILYKEYLKSLRLYIKIVTYYYLYKKQIYNLKHKFYIFELNYISLRILKSLQIENMKNSIFIHMYVAQRRYGRSTTKIRKTKRNNFIK